MYNETEMRLIFKEISRDMVEKKYGGNLPNLTKYWPPYDYMSKKEN